MQAKKPWNKEFVFVSCLVGVIVIATWGYYFWTFAEKGPGDQGTFGTFGDFVGGVLNPILSAVTVLYLVRSFGIQSDALAKSEQFHAEQQLLAKREQERHQLEDFVRGHMRDIRDAIEAKAYQITELAAEGEQEKTYRCSLADMYLSLASFPTVGMINKVKLINAGAPYKGIPPVEKERVATLHKKFTILNAMGERLLELLDSEAVRLAWIDAIGEVLHDGVMMGMFDRDLQIKWMANLARKN